MTLIEVVASLALLGTLLGSAVIAKSRLTRQWSAAQHRAEAVAVLDAQLEQWHAQASQVNLVDAQAGESTAKTSGWPTSGEGPLDVEPWWWRAEPLKSDGTSYPPGLQLIRYTAFTPGSSPGSDLHSGGDAPSTQQPGVSNAAVTLDVWVYEALDTEVLDTGSLPPRLDLGGRP